MSVIPRYSPPTLLGDTGTYLWGTRITKLPINVVKMSREGQERFMQALRNTENFSFRILTPIERETMFQKRWAEIEKTIPKGHYTDKVFSVVRAAGAILLVIVSALGIGKARL